MKHFLFAKSYSSCLLNDPYIKMSQNPMPRTAHY